MACCLYQVLWFDMMTLSNGNIFRFTGHLCGKITGHRWIPHTKASDEALMFYYIDALTNRWVNNGEAGDVKHHCTHYDVTVISLWPLRVRKGEIKTKQVRHFAVQYFQYSCWSQIFTSKYCLTFKRKVWKTSLSSLGSLVSVRVTAFSITSEARSSDWTSLLCQCHSL